MIRSNKIFRTVLTLALALCLAVSVLPAAALADEESTRGGSITLDMSEKVFSEDLKAYGATFDVDLYHVATVDANGIYTATEAFSAIADQIAAIGLNTDMRALTDAIEGIIFPKSEEDDENGEAGEAAEPVSPTRTVEGSVGGTITFGADQLGLYLIVPHEAESLEYLYTFSSMLLSVPALGTDYDAEHGREPSNSEEGEDGEATQQPQEHLPWQYDYNVFLKAERHKLTGRIVIEKSLLTWNQTLGAVKFVFEVTATDKDGIVVFSDVVTLEFDGPVTKRATVKGIPAGTTVTVKEVYSGGSYEIREDPNNQGTYQIVPVSREENGPPVASFTNDYDDTIIPSIGVVNHFEGDGNGWNWSQPDDNSDQ